MTGSRRTAGGVRFPAKKEKSFLIVFAFSFCAIILFVTFFPSVRSIENDAYIKTLEKRVRELEARLDEINLDPEKIRNIHLQGSKVESFINNYNRLDASLSLKTNLLADRMDKQQVRIDSLNQKVAGLEKRKSTPPRKVSRSAVGKKSVSTGRQYHSVAKGETFYGISRKYGLSLTKLKELNGFTEKTVIYPGQKIRIR